MKVTKKELIDLTYQSIKNVNKSLVSSIINQFFVEINNIFSKNEEVDIEIRGFGVFRKRKRKDIEIFNPKTNKMKLFHGLYSVRFKKSKESKIKKEVNPDE